MTDERDAGAVESAGKRRLVLPAPPSRKKPAVHISDQNEAANMAATQGAVQQQAESEEEEDLGDLPNDTEAALHLLKSQFHAKVRAASQGLLWHVHSFKHIAAA